MSVTLLQKNDFTSNEKRSVLLFIQECGFMLRAKDLTTATACYLFQKCSTFVLENEFSNQSGIPQGSLQTLVNPVEIPNSTVPDYYLMATACLLLAGKIEENHLNIRRLVNVSYKNFFKDRELSDINEFYNMRSSILNMELWILRVVGFNPVVVHPHMYLACFLKALEDWLPRDVQSNHPLTGVCWSVLKDSYLSDIILKASPEHIAVAIIAFGLQLLKITVPCQETTSRLWMKACCADLSSERLDGLVLQLLELYEDQSR